MEAQAFFLLSSACDHLGDLPRGPALPPPKTCECKDLVLLNVFSVLLSWPISQVLRAPLFTQQQQCPSEALAHLTVSCSAWARLRTPRLPGCLTLLSEDEAWQLRSKEKNGTASEPHFTVRAGADSSASHSQRGSATEMGNLKTLSWFNRFLGCIFWWRAFIDSTMLVLLNKASTQMRKTWSLSCNELWVIFFGVPLLASYRSSVHLVWYLA